MQAFSLLFTADLIIRNPLFQSRRTLSQSQSKSALGKLPLWTISPLPGYGDKSVKFPVSTCHPSNWWKNAIFMVTLSGRIWAYHHWSDEREIPEAINQFDQVVSVWDQLLNKSVVSCSCLGIHVFMMLQSFISRWMRTQLAKRLLSNLLNIETRRLLEKMNKTMKIVYSSFKFFRQAH